MTPKKIMILAGEPSGDLHGSNLILELKKLSPKIEIFGIGGEKMKNAGARLFFDLKDLAIIGIIDVIKNYSRLKNIQKTLLNKIAAEKPDLICLIDYPDFNLRFAKKAKGTGVPIIYYIAPQVWAWRRHRIRLIKKCVSKVYVIFKFEEEIYRKAGIPVEFIGHPLLDIVKTSETREQFVKSTGLDSKKIIALLPGSRESIVKRTLPVMLEAAKKIYEKMPEVNFLISKSPSLAMGVYGRILDNFPLPGKIIENRTYDIINAADMVIVVSGTATLETAIIGTPMVIVYKLPLLEYALAKSLLLLKNIGLVNIVAGKTVVPELIQFGATPGRIAETTIGILNDKSRYVSIKAALAGVKKALLPDGASRRAASSILS